MKNFYLNPAIIKEQCACVARELQNLKLEISKVSASIISFIDNKEVESNAFMALKQQMAVYNAVLKNIDDLIGYYIGEYINLTNSVGDEVLDSNKIYQGQEICRKSIRSCQEMVDSVRDAGVVVDLMNIDKVLLSIWEGKEQKYYEIDQMTKDLFADGENMLHKIRAALSSLGRSFKDNEFHIDINATWIKDLEKESVIMNAYEPERPKGLNAKQWKEYTIEIKKHVRMMVEQGWDEKSIKAYGKYLDSKVKHCNDDSVIKEMRKVNEETQVIGSNVFIDMWNAWKTNSGKYISRQKLQLVMDVSGMNNIDENSTPEEFRKITAKINPDLPPHSKFWADFAKMVQNEYGECGMTDLLGRKIHLFRYVISDQQVRYIRNHFKGKTDEEKLIKYCAIIGDDWTEKESVRMHLKEYNMREVLPEGHSESNDGINYKIVVNKKFHSEFIINGNGDFLNLLDEGATQDAIINCASFNYARENNSVHDKLDGDPTSKYEPIFRENAYYVRDVRGNKLKNEYGEFILFKAPGKYLFFEDDRYEEYRRKWYKMQHDFVKGVLICRLKSVVFK